jgi:CubicO group peptidase (beta-lactamase class C family)
MAASEVVVGGGDPGDFALVRHVRLEGTQRREELAGPLGIDCHIGLDLEAELIKNAGPMAQKALNNPPKTVADMNTRSWRRAEIPGGNAHTNARALARVYGALACGGEVDGVRVLSPESIERARAEQADGPDAVLFGLPTRYGLGFRCRPTMPALGRLAAAPSDAGRRRLDRLRRPRRSRRLRYTMNQMQPGMPPDSRAFRMIDALYASL